MITIHRRNKEADRHRYWGAKSDVYCCVVGQRGATAVDVQQSSVRDSVISGDLSDLPQYLADLYRQQRVERQRDEQLAARDLERLENIDRMWKELDTLSTIGNTQSTADRQHNTSLNGLQRKPTQQVLVLTSFLLSAEAQQLLNVKMQKKTL